MPAEIPVCTASESDISAPADLSTKPATKSPPKPPAKPIAGPFAGPPAPAPRFAACHRRRIAASCTLRSRERRIPTMSSHEATSSAHVQMAPIRNICALVVRIEAPKKVRESGVAAAVTTPTASRSTAAITPSATAITVVHFLWR